MKMCSNCKKILTFISFTKCKTSKDGYQNYCRDCSRLIKREWMAANPEKAKIIRARNQKRNSYKWKEQRYASYLKRKYNIGIDEYNKKLESQGGVCEICGMQETKRGSNGLIQPLSVDHNHETGDIRGLICHRCNTLVGQAENRLAKKINEYLTKYISVVCV